MTVAPLIGLTGRRKLGHQIDGFPGNLEDLPVELFISDYARCVREAGGIAVYLPLGEDPGALVDRLDGLVLTGGADVDPAVYGVDPDADASPPEPERDRFELALLTAATDAALPVLGVCRGLQLVNVWAGGSLHQHVPAHARFDVAPSSRVHQVRFAPGSCLAGLYGERRSVNSLHHQTVDRVGVGFEVTATADDGTIEGIERNGHQLLAVQWHPEMVDEPEPVFSWLVERAGVNAAVH